MKTVSRLGAYAVIIRVTVKMREPTMTTCLQENLLQRKLHRGPTTERAQLLVIFSLLSLGESSRHFSNDYKT